MLYLSPVGQACLAVQEAMCAMTFKFELTPEIVRALQVIERSRTEVQMVVLPPVIAERLRQRARALHAFLDPH